MAEHGKSKGMRIARVCEFVCSLLFLALGIRNLVLHALDEPGLFKLEAGVVVCAIFCLIVLPVMGLLCGWGAKKSANRAYGIAFLVFCGTLLLTGALLIADGVAHWGEILTACLVSGAVDSLIEGGLSGAMWLLHRRHDGPESQKPFEQQNDK